MEHERKLEIPKELYHNGEPQTLHIWPSIFTGKVLRYKGLEEIKLETGGPRLRLRKWLISHGIKWNRDGIKVKKFEEPTPDTYKPKWKVYQTETDTILDNYDSYAWNIPGVSPSFILGGNTNHYKQDHHRWKILSRGLSAYHMELAAIYTAYLDWLGHWMSPLKLPYFEVFDLANSIGRNIPVMLVSDHGCINGQHTHNAYLGCTHAVRARSVIEVHEDIVRILSIQVRGD